MSLVDPECHPSYHGSSEDVCAACVGISDLRKLIREYDGPRGCDFCGRSLAPTMPLGELAEFIGERMGEFYGRAVDQLPYESREGGYQAWHEDTYDLLFDTIGLDLPRDDGTLARAIADEIGDDAWCDYDWLALEPDESLRFSWDRFCEIVKHERRFFFHNVGAGGRSDPDSRSPLEFLQEVAELVVEQGLVTTEPKGFSMYRARGRQGREKHTTPAALGPPPPQYATQSNRMNPPGVSMMYGADRISLAIAETRAKRVSVGKFETLRSIRLLDLANLPELPGFFSQAGRMERLTLAFLHQFSDLILQPVAGDDRTHVEYIPTQVFTEFLRDFRFSGGRIDGVRYRSATGLRGTNVVLFAAPEDVVDATEPPPFGELRPWLRLIKVLQKSTPSV